MSLERNDPHYFGAGPALLPTAVLQDAATKLVNYENLGIGLGELSHRSKQAIAIIESAKQNVAKILDIPDTHEVFFLQGGGTAGFSAVVYSMMASFAKKSGGKKGKADYLVTGSWSQKAAEEAVRLGVEVNYVVHSKKADGKYGSIPDSSTWKFGNAEDTAYVYYCDNETVSGVEFADQVNVPSGVELVADMSSNFLSRPVDVSKFGLIFGGAQKNIGIAGVSLYIVKKSLLDYPDTQDLLKAGIPVGPIFLDFPKIVENNSTYNTLPIFPVYILSKTVDLLIQQGGLSVQAQKSKDKADKIYSVIDSHSDFYICPVGKNARSRMNIIFTLKSTDLEDQFIKKAAELGMTGLKGHRSVGGIRVSNYNAVSAESIDLLAKFMTEFAEA